MKPCIPEHLPIKGIDWEPLIPLISTANRALARYDGVLSAIPNPGILLSPLTTQEAVLSSKIEGTLVTLGEVLKHEAGDEAVDPGRRVDIQEIANYRRALRVARDEMRTKPFHLNLLKRLHGILLDSVRGRHKSRGHFRRVQNYIGKPGTKPVDALFVPPAPHLLMPALDNWEKYYHSDTPDPLVQLALVHAQFEIIHPFEDGNGRLGRILIPLYLKEKEILSEPMFYLSAYLEQHRDQYVEGLRDITGPERAWNAWITFFLQALLAQADENTSRARKIQALYAQLKERARMATHSQFAIHLLDALFKTPMVTISMVAAGRGMPSRPMIDTMLNQLRAAGILKIARKGAGRRPQVYALTELINIAEGRKVF